MVAVATLGSLPAALAVPALAQTTPQGEQVSAAIRPSREDLRRRIEVLEAQVAELKALVYTVEPEPSPAAEGLTPPAEAPRPDFRFGVNLDTYYMYSFHRPVGRVNLLRAYDVLSNNFSLDQANLVLESAPHLEAGRRFGGRLDLQWGEATETLQGSLANEPRPWVYRNIFQAYGTYVAPLGSGLTIDFGKWASSLGYESNYSKDQMNYSRSYWFNFLPFYHMGARLNYRISDAVALNYWVTNGTQQTEAFNNFKDQYLGLVVQPTKTVSWNIQYYLGQEHPDVEQIQAPGPPTLPTQPGLSVTPVVPYFAGKLHIFDTYASWQPSSATTLALEGDYVVSGNVPPAGDSRVWGGALYLRHQVSPRSAVAVRAEYLRDEGGLFSGVSQAVKETTLTYDFKVSEGLLLRGEWRHDFSNAPFFLTHEAGVLDKTQDSLTLAATWWWGTKRNAW